MTDRECTTIPDWPGYWVYRHEIDEEARTPRLWVRHKRGNKRLLCLCCGGKATRIEEVRQWEVRDLPWRKYRAIVYVEYYRVRCPKCGLKVEEVPQSPSKAPFSKDFEDAVGLACESAPARQVARQFGLPASTVRAIDPQYLERWARKRKRPVPRQMGMDEIYLGKTRKFITVVTNLETSELLWFGRERKEETLDEFFRTRLSAMQHANRAVDEVRRAESFRKRGWMRGLVKGKRWVTLGLGDAGWNDLGDPDRVLSTLLERDSLPAWAMRWQATRQVDRREEPVASTAVA